LKGLAEGVKLSAYGRQPTIFLSFSFSLFYFSFFFLFFLTDISPVVFHNAYFYYIAGVVLYFSKQVFLRRSLGGYNQPHIFLSTQYCISIYILETMYHLSLGVGKKKFVVLL
jgi:hypothetical protein